MIASVTEELTVSFIMKTAFKLPESKMYLFFQLSDFHNYAVHGVLKDNEKLERAVFLFNNITHWVQCMVLDHHNVSDRAQAIVKFVEVAKVQEMFSYNKF